MTRNEQVKTRGVILAPRVSNTWRWNENHYTDDREKLDKAIGKVRKEREWEIDHSALQVNSPCRTVEIIRNGEYSYFYEVDMYGNWNNMYFGLTKILES